jgi:hypothetical protein
MIFRPRSSDWLTRITCSGKMSRRIRRCDLNQSAPGNGQREQASIIVQWVALSRATLSFGLGSVLMRITINCKRNQITMGADCGEIRSRAEVVVNAGTRT